MVRVPAPMHAAVRLKIEPESDPGWMFTIVDTLVITADAELMKLESFVF